MYLLLDYSAIFFDFDGLLVNTEHLHYEAYRQMMLQNDSSFPWNLQAFANVAHKNAIGLRQMITHHDQQLVNRKGWDTLYMEKNQCYQDLLKQGSLELMPGANQILNFVRKANISHCVVTNSTKKQVQLIQDYLPTLKQIPLFVTREDYNKPKPAPDGYLRAISLLKPQGKMIGFEDTLRGIHSLQSARIDPVLICSENHPQLEAATENAYLYFSSFTKVLPESKAT